DFEAILDEAKKDDFVYFDPPYYPETSGGNFTSYQKDKFLENEHKKLFEVFKKLDAQGCLCMLSNSNTKFIKDLYKEYNQTLVKARRMINCNGNGRGETEELVITNYS
ncbi:DNA adenine methylase, partial [Candidatus Woesearchaeota archaeon]|nr:DNA adenine methylase [Candidatus Woesearchaeota archaeon]